MSNDLFRPGAVLRGKYRVERVLGTGGMGIVVLATHLRMSQLVAIKLLLPEHRERGEIVTRFAREARAASKLRGEHAVRILDVDDSEAGDPFLVMEYLEGMDLECALRTGGALPYAKAADYLLQACEGIAEAHALGIVHRDLKPANLFLATRTDGSPLLKILDFGISKSVDVESAADFLVTKPLVALGSPAYMSPEQLRDTANVDVRTDIWSLGVILYQLLTNTLPFEGTTTAALAARIAADPPPPWNAKHADPLAPLELEHVVLRCLEKDRAKRFADVADLAQALAPFAAHGESGALRIARVAETTARRGTSSAASPPLVPKTVSGDATTQVESPATASLHDVVPSGPLAKALVTEYASTVGADTAQPAPRKTARWMALALVAAVGVVAMLSMRNAPAPAVVATPTIAPAMSVVNDIAATDAAAAIAPTATTAPVKSASRAVVPRAASAKPPPRNPMDIEFR